MYSVFLKKDLKSSLLWMLSFSVVTISCYGVDYDERLAMKQKKLDLEYGERMSRYEGRQMASLTVVRNNTKFVTAGVANQPSTKCTTNKPIKLDPLFVPSSSDDENNEILSSTSNLDDKSDDNDEKNEILSPNNDLDDKINGKDENNEVLSSAIDETVKTNDDVLEPPLVYSTPPKQKIEQRYYDDQ